MHVLLRKYRYSGNKSEIQFKFWNHNGRVLYLWLPKANWGTIFLASDYVNIDGPMNWRFELYLPLLTVYCGRGDKKTKRGKRFNHSYGNVSAPVQHNVSHFCAAILIYLAVWSFQARPRNKKKGTGPPRLFAPPAPPRKDQFDDGEIIPIEIDEDILE